MILNLLWPFDSGGIDSERIDPDCVGALIQVAYRMAASDQELRNLEVSGLETGSSALEEDYGIPDWDKIRYGHQQRNFIEVVCKTIF